MLCTRSHFAQVLDFSIFGMPICFTRSLDWNLMYLLNFMVNKNAFWRSEDFETDVSLLKFKVCASRLVFAQAARIVSLHGFVLSGVVLIVLALVPTTTTRRVGEGGTAPTAFSFGGGIMPRRCLRAGDNTGGGEGGGGSPVTPPHTPYWKLLHFQKPALGSRARLHQICELIKGQGWDLDSCVRVP